MVLSLLSFDKFVNLYNLGDIYNNSTSKFLALIILFKLISSYVLFSFNSSILKYLVSFLLFIISFNFFEYFISLYEK